MKPHGALYNVAAKDKSVAEAIAKAVYNVDPNLVLFGLANSHLVQEGRKTGLRVANEVFADRTYQSDGSLTPRTNEQALIHDLDVAINQVVTMVKQGEVTATDGTIVPIQADTICVHGDGEKALQFVTELRTRIGELEGISLSMDFNSGLE